MEAKNRAQIKEDIIKGISEELDLWLEKESTLSNGYDYETELLSACRRMNKIVLEGSLGKQPRSRNTKKKS